MFEIMIYIIFKQTHTTVKIYLSTNYQQFELGWTLIIRGTLGLLTINCHTRK